MKDTIVVFSSNVENWGAERSVCSMCDYLHRQGFHVLVVLPREGLITNLLESIHVEYVVLPYEMWIIHDRSTWRPDRYLRKVFRIWRKSVRIRHEILSRGYNPILVYSSTITFGTGLYCAKKWNVPHVHHFRENIDAFGYKFVFGNLLTMRYIRKTTTRIICTCNAVKDRYSRYLDGAEIHVVNNGVPAVHNVTDHSVTDNVNIIQVARFMDDKRVIDSLNAIDILVKDGYTNLKLDIYGKGPEEEMYRSFIESHNLSEYVEVVGFCQNIDFSKYHIGLMTSTFEAFARSTLDYMNNGLEVIASNAGGNTEQVVDKETGLLFEVHDPQSLAECIIRLYKDPAYMNRLGNAGRERFLQHFTQEMYQQKIGGILMSCLKK